MELILVVSICLLSVSDLLSKWSKKDRFCIESIKTFWPKKLVLRNDEIQKVIELKDFDNKEQEYARDIWLFFYRANGINFADLIRMRLDYIQRKCIIFFRKKTESTRMNNTKPLTIPIIPKLQALIDKIGV